MQHKAMLPFLSNAAFLAATPLHAAPRHTPHSASCPQTWRAVPVAQSANKGKKRNYSPTIENRPARFRYELLERHECGIELLGTEIKSVRNGSLTLRDGYGRVKNGELFLHNVHIAPWEQATAFFNHDPVRVRRILLHKRMIRKLEARQKDPGLTIIPVRAYFSKNGYLKIEMALCRGKQEHDRRESIRKREDDRTMRRVVKTVLGA